MNSVRSWLVAVAALILSITGVLASVAAAAPRPTAAAGPQHRFGSFGSALVGSAPVAPGPAAVAVDTATDTVYVASGNNDDGPTSTNVDMVSVIDGRRCQAVDVSHCKGPWPAIKVGLDPSTLAVDEATDTIYVTNIGDNTVSVINGATCNARVFSGCNQTPATVPVGSGPSGIFADEANHTVYVVNSNFGGPGTVSMIDSATCNGRDLKGCPSVAPPTVAVGNGPGDVDVNEVTHTVYVANFNGISAFAENSCNATVQSGCGDVGQALCTNVDPTCNAGFAATVDSDNNTIFQADGDSTLTVFDGRTCDASDLAGCATQTPGTVMVAPPEFFEVSIWLALDARLHTVYAVNQKDDTVSVIDTNICNGRHLTACATLRPPTIHSGEDPESITLNPDTETLYTANQVTNDVSVIDAARCNATDTRGCRQPPSAITLAGPGALIADPAAATLYVATGSSTVSMINTRTCNAYRQRGCTSASPTVTVGAFPAGIVVNARTHTVYVANAGSGTTGTVTVLDDRTCNAGTTSGCKNAHTLQVPGGNALAIAVNPVTDTLYVATAPASGPTGPGSRSTVSVFNGATCDATNTTGCGQAPHTVTVGFRALALAVNTRTDTVYVANFAHKHTPFAGNTVSVIDGATCNAADTTGCGNTPQTITLGSAFTTPIGVAVDQAADTIYVADLQNGEESGTVSVINGATCNATITTGCGHTPPTVTVGFGPSAIAFDPANRTVAVTNIEDTSVSVINAATCNATTTVSCHRAQPELPVGRAPSAVAIDPAARTMYIANGDNTVSVIPETR